MRTGKGLKPNTDYFIDWYSYETGVYTNQSECFNTTANGVWRMNHPILTTTAPILWYVVHENESGCPKNYIQNTEKPTEINTEIRISDSNFDGFESLVISPNPFTNEIHIRSSENISEVTITDNLGRILMQTKTEGNELMVDLSLFLSGIYFVELNGNGTIYSLVKQ